MIVLCTQFDPSLASKKQVMKIKVDELVTSSQRRSNGVTSKKNPEDQSIEEWLADYEKSPAVSYRDANAIESEPKFKAAINENSIRSKQGKSYGKMPPIRQPIASVVEQNINTATTLLEFRYIDHRTTRQGSVAMDFETFDGMITATKFFNVEIVSNRGNKYNPGRRGQFIPSVGGNFRKLWMQAVGKVPTRWCRVHKSLRSHFRELVFTGEITNELDNKGNHYYKLRNVQPRK